MKNLKKLFAICIAAQLAATPITAQAFEAEPISESTVDIRINAFLEQYFKERESNFNDTELSVIQEITAQSDNAVLSSSEMRTCLIAKMEEKFDFTIVSSDTTFSISDTKIEDNYVYLDVYEWTNVEYTGDSGLVDMFGYGVDHSMVLERNDDTYCLLSDTYDEGPLTGMSSSLSNAEFFELMNAEYPDYSEEQTEYDSIHPEEQSFSVQSSSAYNPYKAIEYANKWVSHNADGEYEPSGYNTSEYASNVGADCTNYVSQCMYAGGLEMDPVGNNSDWWYDSKQSCPWSTVWFTVAPHFKYFKNKYTSYTNVTSGYIIPGNPVYYNFTTTSTDYNDLKHAAICVGYDSDGYPIVNSHTQNYYHVRWNFGNTSAICSTIKITNDDVLNTRAGAATITINSPYYAKINSTSDVDYFKFTVPGVNGQLKSYTIETTGTVDTYGKLFSSSGTQLAYDDNSGAQGNNFKITAVLTSGYTYYIAVSSKNNSLGFYRLTISNGENN